MRVRSFVSNKPEIKQSYLTEIHHQIKASLHCKSFSANDIALSSFHSTSNSLSCHDSAALYDHILLPTV
jgi:hypothetical protein